MTKDPTGFLYGGLEHGKETVHKKFPKASEDGQAVTVYVQAMPARFYRIEAHADTDSGGGVVKPFSLSTGSGMEKLACDIAKAVSEGMLALT